MSRFRSGAGEEREESIDISPLIDCVFILLIFFIVTTTFIEETGIEVDKPQAASAVQLESTSLTFVLTRQNKVLFEGREIGLAAVRPEVSRAVREDASVPVIIQAESAAKSDMLVRLIDEARLGGAEKISLAQRKPSA